jgi:transposase
MISLSTATRVFVAPGATDMRKSFNGLFALVRHQLDADPLSGHLFVFCNRSRNRVKILAWDGSGLWILAKRLERGRFHWPWAEASRPCPGITHEELAMLLGGIDIDGASFRRWHRLRGGAAEM